MGGLGLRVAMAEPSEDIRECPTKCARNEETLRTMTARLRCSITGELFVDPVTIADGQVYEREAVEKWFAEKGTSPSTGLPIHDKTLVPCLLARFSVEDLVGANVLCDEERREWLVRRGLFLGSKHAVEAKACFEKAIQLGSAAAKYHFACMLIDEAAAEGVPEARQYATSAGVPDKLVRSAAEMKAAGHSAVEARDAGCAGVDIYALCAKFKLQSFRIRGETGVACVTEDGRFGIMCSMDRNNAGPWIVKGVSDEVWKSCQDLIKRVRPLRWG